MSEEKPVRPFDLFRAYIPGAAPSRASDEDAAERLAICGSCPRLRKKTKICRECGCIMPEKVKLAEAVCPIGKWGKTAAVTIRNT